MQRSVVASLTASLVFLVACSSGTTATSNASAALNLAGTWTVTTVSTQGHAGYSGMGAVSQSGQGLGVAGTTTLAYPAGQMVVVQTGTALAGTNTKPGGATFSYTGTLSNGALTLTGTNKCRALNTTQTITMTGTISSSSVQGTYTITPGTGCSYTSDSGTLLATKK